MTYEQKRRLIWSNRWLIFKLRCTNLRLRIVNGLWRVALALKKPGRG